MLLHMVKDSLPFGSPSWIGGTLLVCMTKEARHFGYSLNGLGSRLRERGKVVGMTGESEKPASKDPGQWARIKSFDLAVPLFWPSRIVAPHRGVLHQTDGKLSMSLLASIDNLCMAVETRGNDASLFLAIPNISGLHPNFWFGHLGIRFEPAPVVL
jgi:hypothetical protein